MRKKKTRKNDREERNFFFFSFFFLGGSFFCPVCFFAPLFCFQYNIFLPQHKKIGKKKGERERERREFFEKARTHRVVGGVKGVFCRFCRSKCLCERRDEKKGGAFVDVFFSSFRFFDFEKRDSFYIRNGVTLVVGV